MSVPFQCPSCMRNLQFSSGDSAFTDCPYCKSKIIVPSTAVHLEEIEEQKPSEFALKEQRDFKLAEIQSELSAGRKINAIKIFRETFGTSLSESKEAVESLERGGNIEISKSALRDNYAAMQNNPANQQIYQNTGQQNQNLGGAAKAILWFLIALAIAAFFIFMGD